MSLGGDGGPGAGPVEAYVNAINEAYKKGILTTTSAGNEAVPVSQASPANTPNALTVAASEKNFTLADFSNYGPGIDFFAPGVGIRGAAAFSDAGLIIADGTSASAPFVAGVAMYLQSVRNFGSTVDLVANLKAMGTSRMSGDLKGSPDLFINNGNGVN